MAKANFIEVSAKLKSITRYSQGGFVTSPRKKQEPYDDHEKRCWKERLHVTEDGRVFMPAMGFKLALVDAAKYLGYKIPGKGQATYTKVFTCAVQCPEDVVLPVKAADVPGEWVMVPSNGKPGAGSRVRKCFPVIEKWEADVKFIIADLTITKDVFQDHLDAVGRFIGIGRFRPQNRGAYGLFQVVGIDWKES